MAFSFRTDDKDMTRALRRLARDRIDHALAALDGGEAPEEALHTARKDIKKLRALLELVRPVFPDWRRENTALREAAREVSALRDRTAMVECYDRLAEGFGAEEAQAVAPLRTALVAGQHPPDTAALTAGLCQALTATRTRSAQWQLKKSGFSALAPGLERSYARGRAAMKRADKTGAAEDFHEFRKRVKAHWYQAMLFTPIAPDLIAPRRKLAGVLGELLGEIHDLVAFAALLPEAPLDPAARSALAARIATERQSREARSLVLGGRLYADAPEALAARWRVWWKLRGR